MEGSEGAHSHTHTRRKPTPHAGGIKEKQSKNNDQVTEIWAWGDPVHGVMLQ